jgi:hypothetical protein
VRLRARPWRQEAKTEAREKSSRRAIGAPSPQPAHSSRAKLPALRLRSGAPAPKFRAVAAARRWNNFVPQNESVASGALISLNAIPIIAEMAVPPRGTWAVLQYATLFAARKTLHLVPKWLRPRRASSPSGARCSPNEATRDARITLKPIPIIPEIPFSRGEVRATAPDMGGSAAQKTLHFVPKLPRPRRASSPSAARCSPNEVAGEAKITLKALPIIPEMAVPRGGTRVSLHQFALSAARKPYILSRNGRCQSGSPRRREAVAFQTESRLARKSL